MTRGNTGERQYSGAKGPEKEIWMPGSADKGQTSSSHGESAREETTDKNPLKEATESVEASGESPSDAPSKIVKGAGVDLDKPDWTYSGQKFQERANRPISQGRPEEISKLLKNEQSSEHSTNLPRQ